TDTGKPLHTLAKLDGNVASLAAFDRNKTLNVVAALNAKDKYDIKIWEIKTGDSFEAKERHTLKQHTAPITSVGLSADGKFLASTELRKYRLYLGDGDGKTQTHLEGPQRTNPVRRLVGGREHTCDGGRRRADPPVECGNG